ncbi:hypothetical protein GPALN_013016 [Globodera pallida]|nr:hypothetical protein GPALN_013016 [Globodera pallida]
MTKAQKASAFATDSDRRRRGWTRRADGPIGCCWAVKTVRFAPGADDGTETGDGLSREAPGPFPYIPSGAVFADYPFLCNGAEENPSGDEKVGKYRPSPEGEGHGGRGLDENRRNTSKRDSQRPFVIWGTMNFALRRKDGQLDKQNILGEKDRRR